MCKQLYIILLLAFSFSTQLQAQQEEKPPSQQQSEKKVVMMINGEPITESLVTSYKRVLQQQLRGQSIDRRVVIEQITKLNLLAQAAEKEQLHTRPEVLEGLKIQSVALLSTLMLQELAQRLKPDEAVLEAFYQDFPSEEYRSSLIVVSDKSQADTLLKKLEEGYSFTSLATQHSLDPTGRHGGNLGWVNAFQVSTTLVNSLLNLKVGKHTRVPIEGPQGWMLVKLHEKRPYTKPAYFQIRQQLEQKKLTESVDDYIRNLESNATITKVH